MALRINTNVGALNAHRRLTNTETEMNKSMGKLSSGYRINAAGDDAAGLVQANSLRASVKTLAVDAQKSLQSKANLQIYEGDANTIENILERMAELAEKGSSTATDSEFNTLLAQIGTIKSASGTTSISSFNVSSVSISSVSSVTSAITSIGTVLGDIGASINKEDFTYQNILTKIENTSASESAIRDADMASEMVTFTRTQIMLQAGTAMLAQANSSSQTILSLFR